MKVEQMEGQHRQTLLRSLGHFHRNTKAAIGTNEGSFLPSKFAYDQVERIEEARAAIPPYDDVDRDFELTEPLNAVCRNAVVVHARIIDKKVRDAEKGENIPTRESDALLAELQLILRELGDERNLEDAINRKRNNEMMEKGDPAQTDLVDELETAGTPA